MTWIREVKAFEPDICEFENFFINSEDGVKHLCRLKDGTMFENERWCDSYASECMLLRAYIDVLSRRGNV